MTYNITLTANHQSLTAEYLPLAAESVQYLTAKVVCETEDWTGREIKAMFGQGCTVHGITVTDGEITAKQQLNLTAGDWRVWLVGNSARDGEVIPRITTNVAHISVAPTGGTEGNPFPTIPPAVEEQLRADMGNLADLTTEDKSSLVAAINEAAASGGSKDAVTYTPQTLTEEQQKQARTNIGAEKAGTGYTKPASGIPKSDLAQSVQTSLAKADTAISLGLTAATPGQIIKVKTVQDGKPTEWGTVDMPGEDYEFVQSFKLSPDVAYYELASVAEYRSIRINVIRGTQDNALGNGNLFLRVGYAGNVVGSTVQLSLMTTGFKRSFYFGEVHAGREYAWGSLFYGNNTSTLTTGIGFGTFDAVDNKYKELLENIDQCVYSLLYATPAETIDGQETVYVYGVRR